MISIQLRTGKIHAAEKHEGFMSLPICGGNRAAEGYREVKGEVNCANCLKALAKAAEKPAEAEAPETAEAEPLTFERKKSAAGTTQYRAEGVTFRYTIEREGKEWALTIRRLETVGTVDPIRVAALGLPRWETTADTLALAKAVATEFEALEGKDTGYMNRETLAVQRAYGYPEVATTEGETVTTDVETAAFNEGRALGMDHAEAMDYAQHKAKSAIISEAVPADTNEGENTMSETTTEAAKLDVNTDEGKAALEQIDANIERARVLATEDNAEALEELGAETEGIISRLSGKGNIKAKKEKRDAWKAAVAEAEKPKAVAKKATAAPVVAKEWDAYPGTVELANHGVEVIAEGVKAHVKVSHLAKDVAAATLEIWLRIPNKAGVPDLMGDSDAAKKASRAVHEKATQGLEDTYDNREALKKLLRSSQDQRSDVRAEWLRSLDADDETGAERRALVAKVLEGKPEDEKASEWVAKFYGTSTIGQTEKRRLEYQAKKALEAAGEKPAEGAGEGAEGEGAEGASEEATASPDEVLKKIVDRLYKDVEKADVSAFEKASDTVKESERKRLEAVKKAVTEMIATLL